MTEEETKRVSAFFERQKEVSRQLQVAEKDFDESRSQHLERKHKVDELRKELLRMAADGPYKEAETDPQMRLFDDSDFEDAEEEDDEEGLIDELAVPAKLRVTLKKNGVERMEDLQAIIDGQNATFPNGLADISDLDQDAKNRIAAAFKDWRDDPDAEDDTTVYAPPLPNATPVIPAATSTVPVRIILKVDLPDMSLQKGDEVEAMPTPTGEMLVVLGDEEDDKALLQSGEYALA